MQNIGYNEIEEISKCPKLSDIENGLTGHFKIRKLASECNDVKSRYNNFAHKIKIPLEYPLFIDLQQTKYKGKLF